MVYNEDYYSSFFKNSQQVMLIIDYSTADIVDANSAACSYYGYTLSEITKMKISQINMLSPEEIYNAMKNVVNSQKKIFIFKHKLANGEIRDVEVFTGILTLNDKQYLYSIVNDITEKRETEKKLLEYSKLLEGVLQGIPDIIGVYKPDHSIVFYNQAGYDFYNTSKEEVIGKKCYEMLCQDKSCSMCTTRLALEKKRLVRFERYFPQWDKYMDCSANPIYDEEGNPVLIIEQLRDITAREKELKHAADIQQQRLTSKFPLPGKAELASVYAPADTVSGDFYHLHRLNDNLVIGILGDISGKGISAALSVSAVNVLFHEAVIQNKEPYSVIRYMNSEIEKHLGEEFVAVCCFSLDFVNGRASVVGAGINEFVFQSRLGKFEKRIVRGPFLGMFRDGEFDIESFEFEKGDMLHFYTDGFEALFEELAETSQTRDCMGFEELRKFIERKVKEQEDIKDDSTWLGIRINC